MKHVRTRLARIRERGEEGAATAEYAITIMATVEQMKQTRRSDSNWMRR